MKPSLSNAIAAVILMTIATLLVARVTGGIGSALALVILSPLSFMIIRDEKAKEKDRLLQNAFNQSYYDICNFTYTQAQSQKFGNDLAAPLNIGDIAGSWVRSVSKPNTYNMALKFNTINRTPLTAAICKLKEQVFQSEYDWAMQTGGLQGRITVTSAYYSNNSLWVNLEVTP